MSVSLPEAAQNNDQIKKLLDGPDSHVAVADAITILGMSTSEVSVRRYRKKSGWKPLGDIVVNAEEPSVFTDDDVSSGPTLEEMNAELRSANARLYRAYSKSKQKRDELINAVYTAAKDAALSVPSRPIPAPRKDKRTKSEQVALWHTTDWQMAKETDSYNSNVCIERMRRYVEMCNELTEVQRADHPVRHGVVLMTGDMLEGVSIFPYQAHEIDADLFTQIFQTAELEEWLIQEALKTYESVDVICEWGNHGRIGKKSDGFKPSDNIDRIIYEVVRKRFEDEPRINKFQVSSDWYQHFTVGNYSAIAIHGDEIKGFGGNLPSYGILRKGNAWASGVVEPFHDMYMGHYHQNMVLSLANGGSVYMTGAVESDNEFAREFVASALRPSQRINFIHPELGIVTSDSRIWLD